MRAASVFAMVASLLFFAGCSSMGGSPCGNGGCDGYGAGGATGFFGGGTVGCDSGCDAGGGGTSASFSDMNCGPMCGAYLQDGQMASGDCGCTDCQMGMSYLQSRMSDLRGSRPLAGVVAGAFSGPCRGLGASVGCMGCGECGGSAIGLNHSDTSGPMTAGGGCDQGGCLGGGCGLGAGIRGFFAGKSFHPYGGEIPHTASAAGGAGQGQAGAAPTYAYPYYTTRGPRDFLMMNPPTIGR